MGYALCAIFCQRDFMTPGTFSTSYEDCLAPIFHPFMAPKHWDSRNLFIECKLQPAANCNQFDPMIPHRRPFAGETSSRVLARLLGAETFHTRNSDRHHRLFGI